jgi:hypothetical protein
MQSTGPKQRGGGEQRSLSSSGSFLALQNEACCTLDRTWTLAILAEHGVGPRTIQAFLKKTWDGDALVSKQAGFCSEPFDVRQGVRCGDIDSPVIFNIVVNAII